MEVQTWQLSDISVQDRIRRDLGDLDDLKASMSARGLINPIGVTANGVLVTGERRLTAASELGWTVIDARVYRDVSDLEMLDVEVEENTCRKALTPGEAEKRYQARRKLLQETEGGQGTRSDLTSANFAEVPSPDQRQTRRKAAKGTGFSDATLDKVAKVREAAEDESTPEEVREEAKKQHDKLMDGSTKADPALQAVNRAKKKAADSAATLKTGLGPGQWIDPPKPPKAAPTISQQVVDAISKGKGLADAAAEIHDDLDLSDDTIKTLRQRLSGEIKERQQLNAALKGVLDKRKANS
jgi:ParB family chromosome partitioning protein